MWKCIFLILAVVAGILAFADFLPDSQAKVAYVLLWVFLFLAGALFTRPRWPNIDQNPEENYREPPSEWPD